MPCRCALGHVVHHIPVSLLYWPWNSDVLKISTPAMQKASFSQKCTFYARLTLVVPVPPSDMCSMTLYVWVLVWVPLLLVVLSRQNAHFCYCMRTTFAYVFFSIHSNFHFICILTSAFSCSPLPPTWLLVVGLRQSGQSVHTECLFR